MQSDVRQDVNYHHDRVSKKAGVTLKNQILCKKIFETKQMLLEIGLKLA